MTIQRLPIIIFGVFYAATFLVGALLLLSGWQAFAAMFQAFSGLTSFYLEPEAVFTNLLLAFVAPVLLFIGYHLGLKRVKPREPQAQQTPTLTAITIGVPWLATIAVAVASLFRAQAHKHALSWLNYRDWIQARLALFQQLDFFEFANMYVFLPVLTALLVLHFRQRTARVLSRTIICVGFCLPLVLVDLLLFQKRYVLISLILLSGAWLLKTEYTSNRTRSYWRRRRLVSCLGLGSYLLYSVLVVMPSLATTSQALATVSRQADNAIALLSRPPDPGPSSAAPASGSTTSARPTKESQGRTGRERLRKAIFRKLVYGVFPGRWVGIPAGRDSTPGSHPRGIVLFLFALLAPVVRTPPPALAYPAIFPKQVGFFGLDLAGDVLGWGQMPNDNLLVYRSLYNTAAEGAVSVPFQYAFFCQVGLSGALLLSFLLGYVLAKLWHCLLKLSIPVEMRATACALGLIFCIFLSMDSVRNSLIASYGVVWGFALLGGMYLFLHAGKRVRANRRSSEESLGV